MNTKYQVELIAAKPNIHSVLCAVEGLTVVINRIHSRCEEPSEKGRLFRGEDVEKLEHLKNYFEESIDDLTSLYLYPVSLAERGMQRSAGFETDIPNLLPAVPTVLLHAQAREAKTLMYRAAKLGYQTPRDHERFFVATKKISLTKPAVDVLLRTYSTNLAYLWGEQQGQKAPRQQDNS
jgi:hypothetical protein